MDGQQASSRLLEFIGPAGAASWKGTSDMPTYQYRCEKCGRIFDHVEHLAEHEKAKLTCPDCGSKSIAHMPTPFVAKTSKKS
jgi:putative FmdB family regulatory protein